MYLSDPIRKARVLFVALWRSHSDEEKFRERASHSVSLKYLYNPKNCALLQDTVSLKHNRSLELHSSVLHCHKYHAFPTRWYLNILRYLVKNSFNMVPKGHALFLSFSPKFTCWKLNFRRQLCCEVGAITNEISVLKKRDHKELHYPSAHVRTQQESALGDQEGSDINPVVSWSWIFQSGTLEINFCCL